MAKKKNKYNKKKFIATFLVAMTLLAAIRHGFSIPVKLLHSELAELASTSVNNAIEELTDTVQQLIADIPQTQNEVEKDTLEKYEATLDDTIPSIDSTQIKPQSPTQNKGHRLIGVHSWIECFPDSQQLQLDAAIRNGIPPCSNRAEVDRYIKNHKLVNISNSPFYLVDDLKHSMPYLVPKAQQLLNTISLNFIDSLNVKGIAPHMLMITSALRTTDDVINLQQGNRNATTNSCHCYGTTIDITYNRFVPLIGKYNPKQELLMWDLPMKQALGEVLRDLREQGKCYVKYEYKQACFHLTVR